MKNVGACGAFNSLAGLQVRTASHLIKLAMYYSAMQAVRRDKGLLQAVVKDISRRILRCSRERDVHAAMKAWVWDDVDKRMLTTSFAHLPTVQLHNRAWHNQTTFTLNTIFELLEMELRILSEV
jgi:hypothetical protein